MRSLNGPLAVAVLGLVLVACGDTTGPLTGLGTAASVPAMSRGSDGGGDHDGEHQAIRSKPGAPPLATTHASFWAVQGRHTGVVIEYSRSREEDAEDPFLEFTVPSKAQLVDPTGRPLARGDSILIDVQVVPGQLAARFSPAGLVFAGMAPARLAISYRYGDAVEPARQLVIWYQPCDGGPWELQSSRMERKDDMVVGDITHFSNYAVAYRK
jgi:hypothetical protein